PSPSSSPRCAAVSCTTFRPRRTERTSRQYVCARPPFRTTVCRRYTAPHPARSLSPEIARPARAQRLALHVLSAAVPGEKFFRTGEVRLAPPPLSCAFLLLPV